MKGFSPELYIPYEIRTNRTKNKIIKKEHAALFVDGGGESAMNRTKLHVYLLSLVGCTRD